MGIKTEDMVKGLPGKEITADVDWLGILDSFEPSQLEEKYLNECARRNSYDTCYRWDTPPRPIEERLRHSEWAVKSSRKDLENCVARIESEGLSHLNYKLARAALIKAIGDKGAAEYNRREYEKLGEEGRWRQAEEYRQWEADWDAAREREKMEYAETGVVVLNSNGGTLWRDWISELGLNKSKITAIKASETSGTIYLPNDCVDMFSGCGRLEEIDLR